MKATIKGLISPDVENLETFQPKQKDNFSIFFQVLIGPLGLEGSESFNIQVCTPVWLINTKSIEAITIGRGLLIVQQYDFGNILATLSRFCTTCEGETWHEVATKASRLGIWEFEDYQG